MVAALAVWKLSQNLCESCNFSSTVAVLAVLCVSAVLQSYLVGFVLLYVQHCNCSHMIFHNAIYFSASVPSLKCASARGMSYLYELLCGIEEF